MAVASSVFTLPSFGADVAETYDALGYVIFQNLLPQPQLDDVLDELARFKRARMAVYYSQSVHRWVRLRLSSEGFMLDSMENPTRHINLPASRAAVMNVLYHDNVTKALHLISGKEKFVSWQDMPFDRSVGTVERDWKQMKPTNNPGIYRKGMPELQFVAKGYARYLWDTIRGRRRPIDAMSRSEYAKEYRL